MLSRRLGTTTTSIVCIEQLHISNRFVVRTTLILPSPPPVLLNYLLHYTGICHKNLPSPHQHLGAHTTVHRTDAGCVCIAIDILVESARACIAFEALVGVEGRIFLLPLGTRKLKAKPASHPQLWLQMNLRFCCCC